MTKKDALKVKPGDVLIIKATGAHLLVDSLPLETTAGVCISGHVGHHKTHVAFSTCQDEDFVDPIPHVESDSLVSGGTGDVPVRFPGVVELQ